MRKNTLQMKASLLVALASLALMTGPQAVAQTPAVNPPPNVNLKDIHETLDEMDKDLDELRENSLRGNLTYGEMLDQFKKIIGWKVEVMRQLPPWGPAIGVQPHGVRWDGSFLSFYGVAEDLDVELDEITGEADSIAAVWGRWRPDSQGDRSSILEH